MTAPGFLREDLRERVARWRRQEIDPASAAALDDLTARVLAGDRRAAAELADAFSQRLSFGTAGLRGAMGPGPNRMNRVVVSQAAAGLAAYLQDRGDGGGTVLVGFDARHGSRAFAVDSAEVLAGAGFAVSMTAAPVPTPVVAFGVRYLGCVAAVMVTASHNPATDNGYKVYLGDGRQIVPPADEEIAARVATVAERPVAGLPRSTSFRLLGTQLVDAYLNRLTTVVPPGGPRDLSWVYTPLHGVGGDVVAAAARCTGFPPMVVVASQALPDPDFPTVAFPNPEEPGALDLALQEGTACGADLVVANDPDADRCAVAVRVGGGWRVLRGDEIGALLGDDALRRGVAGTYACSVVSGSLLGVMASAHGQPFATTLTGFKWIGRVPKLVFGYEEALGFCVDPAAVADKDGISALLRVLALASELKARGATLADRLAEIASTYGVYETDQLSLRVAEASHLAEVMGRLRKAPPERLAGDTVTVTDLAEGWRGLPATDAVRLTSRTATVTVRPSGTEPKLKCYLEVRIALDEGRPVSSARALARQVLDVVRSEMADILRLP